jgi:hypothetical protein
MKRWFLFLLVFPLAACSLAPLTQPDNPPQPNVVSSLPDLGEAPELTNEVWLNTDAPLRLAGLRGSVVLLDMWTFG